MKNKNVISILLITCLTSVVYLCNYTQNPITRSDLRDFSIPDTSKITEIKITSKTPETVVLKRIDKQKWSINNEFSARKSAVFYLLKTLCRMEVAYPVPLSIRDNVLGNLAIKGLKVEVFLNDGTDKTFYVGGENKELTASFMMLENATDPYAVHIPGFRGYLSSRFFTNEYLWRDKKIMDYKAKSITSIKMQYFNEKYKNKSFIIDFEEESYHIRSIETNEKIPSNQLKVDAYKTSFQQLYAENFIMEPTINDTLLSSKPLFNLTVETDNEKTSLKVFQKYSELGEKIYDPERFYAFVNEKDWMIIQKNSFKEVIKTATDLN